MKAFYDAVVIAHALAGLTTIASLLPPLIAKKGSKVHRKAGWAFVALSTAGAPELVATPAQSEAHGQPAGNTGDAPLPAARKACS